LVYLMFQLHKRQEKKMDEKLKDLDTYFQLMTMNGATNVFHTALKLNIFNALAENPQSSAQLALTLAYNEKALSLILKSLCSIDVIIAENDAYHLAPVMQFLKSNYQNLSAEYWEHLSEFVETGEAMVLMDNVEQSEKYYQQQVYSLYWMMRPSAETAAQLLDIGGKRSGMRILDLGCGSAIWSMIFARRDPASTIMLNDWPAVLDLAKPLLKNEGVSERCEFIPGNYHELEFEENQYDMVILANVTHLETDDNLVNLLEKIVWTLKDDGELIIFDIFHSEEGKITASLYELGLALRTENAKVYLKDELENLLNKAGLKLTEFNQLNISPKIMGYIVAKKLCH